MSHNEEACGCGQCVDCAAAFMNRPDPASEIFGWCFNCQREVVWEGVGCHAYPRSDEDPRLDYCGPVWPGVRVHDQAELERLAPELLKVAAPGHWVEWVPGLGRLRLDDDNLLTYCLWAGGYVAGECEHGLRCRPRSYADCLSWLRIAADPDGPPIDIEDVRAVVDQAREAAVRVWIERLGPHVVNSSGETGPWPIVNDSEADTEMDMTDPADWPRELQCWEFPGLAS